MNKVFLKEFGVSAEPINNYHDRDVCYGFNFQIDKMVKFGLVIYFHKTVYGLWWLR